MIEGQDSRGARIVAGAVTWEISFRTAGDLAGHIKRTGPGRTIDQNLSTNIQAQAGVMAN